MNINLNDHRSRISELMMILNDIDSTDSLFKDSDPAYVQENKELQIERYAERLTSFMKKTFESVNVIGDLSLS